MSNHVKNSSLKLKIASNVVLGVLVLSVGALCISPTSKEVTAVGKEEFLYRRAGDNAIGVSLTFNVYQGTAEVYRILDTLKAYDAKATFFIGGCWADDNVDCLKAIHAQGHEIGNHGYFHKEHSKLDEEQNRKEIDACNQFIQLSLGITPTLFAPPCGAYGDATLSVCEELHMKTVLWSKDTIDWRDKNAAIIYTRATKDISIGDFVLMHPTKATADALGDILKYYEKRSLKTVTVSNNLQHEG